MENEEEEKEKGGNGKGGRKGMREERKDYIERKNGEGG